MLGMSQESITYAHRDKGNFIKEGLMKSRQFLLLGLTVIITVALLFTYGCPPPKTEPVRPVKITFWCAVTQRDEARSSITDFASPRGCA